MKEVHPDRYFPADPATREIARRIYAKTASQPILASSGVSPQLFLDPVSNLRADFERLNFGRINLFMSPLERIETFEELKRSGIEGKLRPIYIADAVSDPQESGFVDRLDQFGTLAGCDAYTWKGYLEAHRVRREVFKLYGAKAVLIHPATAQTLSLDNNEMMSLFRKVCIGKSTPAEAEQFRAAMLCEFARMSLDDGLALHIQAGCGRVARVETEKGLVAHVPLKLDYVLPMRPLLQAYGDAAFDIVVFTQDMAALSAELVPIAQSFPAVHVGLGGDYISSQRLRVFREVTAELDRVYPVLAQGDDLVELAENTDRIRRVDAAKLAERVARHEGVE